MRGRTFHRLEGGIIGRMDDLLIIRGVNVYPSAIEKHCPPFFSEVTEFAVDVYRRGTLDEMKIRLEVTGTEPDAIANAVTVAIREALGLRVNVEVVPHRHPPTL